MEYKTGMLFHDRYSLERFIGRGSFSEVWLSNDIKTGIEVAIKIYAPTTGLDENGLSLFAREFSLVVNLNNEYILKPLHFDTCNRNPYLVLPYFPNGSVQKRVGLFKEEEVWKLLFDVSSGLKYLHASNPAIIHQDIKPDNIMIAEDGKYVLSDFGISSHCRSVLRRSVSESFSSAGTTAYMGPERFGKQSGTPIMASDIYSLGATAYELLTGNTPFGDDGGLIQKKGADIPEITVKCSAQLQKIITMCLDPEPWRRPTASQLADYASKGMKGEVILLASTKNKIKKSIPYLAAAIVAVFVLVVVLTNLYKRNNIDEENQMKLTQQVDSIKSIVNRACTLMIDASDKEGKFEEKLSEAKKLYVNAKHILTNMDDTSDCCSFEFLNERILSIDSILEATRDNILSEKIPSFSHDTIALEEFSSRLKVISDALKIGKENNVGGIKN